MIYKYVRVALVASIVASVGTWNVQKWRYTGDIARMQAVAAENTTLAVKAAMKQTDEWQTQKDKALNEANQRAQTNVAAAADSSRAINGLRDERDAAVTRLSNATREAAIDYAKICRAVLQDLAEEGGRIAAKADGHASDATTLDEAWPK